MKSLLIALLSMGLTSTAFAQDCIGSEKAKHFVIYMHGIDSKEPGSQEINNRVILKDLAKKLNLRIALPRASNACPNNQSHICWGWNFADAKIITKSIETATDVAKKCFKLSSNVILLGFSNGGFVINRVVQDCIKTPFSKFISIAASGSWSSDQMTDLRDCGSLTLLIGKRDGSNYMSVKEYHSWLAKNKAVVKLSEFMGKHEMPKKELESVLKNLTQ